MLLWPHHGSINGLLARSLAVIHLVINTKSLLKWFSLLTSSLSEGSRLYYPQGFPSVVQLVVLRVDGCEIKHLFSAKFCLNC